MKVSGIQNTVAFGRALTTKEKKEWEKVQQQARQELNTGKTTATIFDFSIPSTKHDTGIGSSFSEDAQNLAAFLKTMNGINSIQLPPQGEISNYIRSPYSGTSFSLGMHIIDLTKLTEEKYGSLLSKKDLLLPYMNRVNNHETVDYDNVFSPDGQKAMLQIAYKNFKKLDETSALKQEFNRFKEENSYWLEKDALFEAAAVANGSEDMRNWSYRDQNIYAKKQGDHQRIAELKQVTDNSGNNVVDFEEFVQFIADKQQKESKAKFNAKGIEIIGDCQIGFSQKDFWAHKSAFYPNYEFGCKLYDDMCSCWSPAINFSKLEGEAGELLYNKFNTFFKRYDGVRIDAAWQLINPLICEPWHNQGKETYDSNGNKLGKEIDHQPKVKDNGRFIIKDIILKAADENNVPHSNVFLELLGGNAYDSLDAVKDLGTQLIHITRYGKEDWGRVKYYESRGNNKYQNMKPGDYTIGPGTHDDYSLLEQIENGKERSQYLAKDLHLNRNELQNSQARLGEAVWAELFTTKNQFATLPDILGSRRRINLPNTTEGNWSYRAPQDYERAYFNNLSEGKGLNSADALSKALKAKHHGRKTPLTDRLDYFADILRQKGPMTTKEADKLDLNA